MCQNADIGPVRPEGHPRMFVHPVIGEDPGLIRVLEGPWGPRWSCVDLGHFDGLRSTFLYILYMTGSEDQT